MVRGAETIDMTTTYDPTHSLYTDEADVRREVARVFDVCHECRRCVSLCSVFPTLIELIELRDDHDATLMTPAEQDRVVDGCFQCKLCVSDCPYTAGRSESNVDMARLVLRAKAMQVENGHVSARTRLATKIIGRTDRIGKIATRTATFSNRVIAAPPGSLVRRAIGVATGVSAQRLLPSYTHERFSAWFTRRPRITLQKKQARVSVLPTCLVEYQAADIGRDLVKVYERNGIECTASGAGCCGAPLLHAGETARFAKIARKNVKVLAAEVRTGADVVVAQPTCSYVIKNDYQDHVGGADAELVASRTYDSSEYLVTLHQGDDYVLDTNFHGEVPTRITYHAPPQLLAQGVGSPSRDLLRLTGARVQPVFGASGAEAMWGYRADHDSDAMVIAERLGERVAQAGGDVVAGDCHLSNTAITEQTDLTVVHPLQVLARAYGIPQE